MEQKFLRSTRTKKLVLFLMLAVMTVVTPCLYYEDVAAAPQDIVEINGYQISTINEGFRTVYSVNDPEGKVEASGLVYGLRDYVSEADMTIASTSRMVYSYQSTEIGKLSLSFGRYENAQSYAMTMLFIKSADFYRAGIMVRAYAKLKDGTYVYSDVKTCSVYDIADTLYKNFKMNTYEAHNYLYTNILSVVNPDYEEEDYDWGNSIVHPEDMTKREEESTEEVTVEPAEKPTEKVTEKPTEKPTEVPTEKPTEKETEEPTTAPDIIVPKGDKATGVPGKPQITHDQWDTDGEYTISGNMWYGNNATCYVLYEKKGNAGNYSIVATGTLEDDTPNAQSFSVFISGKTIPGTYWYYVEFKNQYGSTSSDEISLTVGSKNDSAIVIETIDDDEIVNQYVMSQGIGTYTIEFEEANPVFRVVSSNKSVVRASIVEGNRLRLEAVNGGRSGIKLIEEKTGETRYFGVRVRESDGSLAALPSYVSIGQVTEDSTADLEFLRATADDDTNKRLDVRYIYINGGPIDGWQSWNPDDPEKRVKSYIIESLKLGIVPYFVYYNIPDASEDYNVDRQHINDTTYMEAYYKDLTFFLETCDKYDAGETVGIILEPDFLGYMMQQAGASPDNIPAAGVAGAYSSGVLTKGVDPDFPNTLRGLVESINYIISTKYPSAQFGWQFNTWGYSGAPGQGLMHATETMGFDAGLAFIKNAAQVTAQFYMSAGILEYGADFISIDKYGLDGAYETGAAENPASSKWLWNSDLWSNYLYYTKTLHETTGFPVTLWQIPVGHLNHSTAISPYTNSVFADLANTEQHYEDSAGTYFFGDTFEPGSSLRLNYFGTNMWNDSKVSVNGNRVTYGPHIEEAADAGVTCILFGAGVGSSTDAVGAPPTDDYWWITKAQQYYNSIMK